MRSRIRRCLFGASFLLLTGSTALRADEFDLVAAGASATINGAIYQQGSLQPAGTGVFDAFLRIQAHDSKTVERGFNTDSRPVPLDDKGGSHTHSLLLSDVGIVSINGLDYRQFALDINEPEGKSLLSLDKLQLFLAPRGDIATLASLRSEGTKVFDQGRNFVVLDANLTRGSGQSDLFVDIPSSLFAGPNPFVYLYSRMGTHNQANGGFEEWSVLQGVQPVPEPSAALLIGMGVVGGLTPVSLRRKRPEAKPQ